MSLPLYVNGVMDAPVRLYVSRVWLQASSLCLHGATS